MEGKTVDVHEINWEDRDGVQKTHEWLVGKDKLKFVV